MISYQDTENIVPADERSSVDLSRPTPHPSRTLYTSSTRCCTTKTSILITKGIILVVGVAVLIAGGIPALTVTHRHVPINCDTNCSVVCQSSPLPTPVPTPTPTGASKGGTTPPFTIVPTPTPNLRDGSHARSTNSIAPVIIAPSPLYVTPPAKGDVFGPNGTSCDCSG